MKSNRKIYRHYGAEHFDAEHVPEDQGTDKPLGLYACPRRTSEDWAQYCAEELQEPERAEFYFDFRLSRREDDADYEQQRREFPSVYAHDPTWGRHLNIEKLKRFDGMEIYMSGNWSELYHTHMFYAYDVDTLVVWNMDKVIEVGSGRRIRKWRRT